MRNLQILLLALLLGCGSGREPPKGYVEACYGGDWSKNIVGRSPAYLVTLDIGQSDWPRLKEILKAYSDRERLRHFDTSEESKALSMLSVSSCSENGLWVRADKRLWRIEGKEDRSSLPLMISVVVYANPEKWTHVPTDLDKALTGAWPGKVRADHGIESTMKSSPL